MLPIRQRPLPSSHGGRNAETKIEISPYGTMIATLEQQHSRLHHQEFAREYQHMILDYPRSCHRRATRMLGLAECQIN